MTGELVKVKGMAEVKAGLADLDAKVSRSILRKGLRAGAKVVLAAAKAEAPVRTGALQTNLKIRAGRGGKGRVTLKVGAKGKDFKGPIFYTDWITGGHYVGSAKLGDARHFDPPNPFIDRAYDSTKETAVQVTISTWLDLIRQAKEQMQ